MELGEALRHWLLRHVGPPRDSVTALYTQMHLQQRLPKEIGRAIRKSAPLTCIEIDIDNFWKFNDQHASQTRDVLLRELAARLQRCVTARDFVAWLDHGTFVVLARDLQLPAAFELGKRIHQACSAESVPVDVVSIRVTVSVGICWVARLSAPTEKVSEIGKGLLTHAGLAVHRAQGEGGGNCVRIFEPDPEDQLLSRAFKNWRRIRTQPF